MTRSNRWLQVTNSRRRDRVGCGRAREVARGGSCPDQWVTERRTTFDPELRLQAYRQFSELAYQSSAEAGSRVNESRDDFCPLERRAKLGGLIVDTKGDVRPPKQVRASLREEKAASVRYITRVPRRIADRQVDVLEWISCGCE